MAPAAASHTNPFHRDALLSLLLQATHLQQHLPPPLQTLFPVCLGLTCNLQQPRDQAALSTVHSASEERKQQPAELPGPPAFAQPQDSPQARVFSWSLDREGRLNTASSIAYLHLQCTSHLRSLGSGAKMLRRPRRSPIRRDSSTSNNTNNNLCRSKDRRKPGRLSLPTGRTRISRRGRVNNRYVAPNFLFFLSMPHAVELVSIRDRCMCNLQSRGHSPARMSLTERNGTCSGIGRDVQFPHVKASLFSKIEIKQLVVCSWGARQTACFAAARCQAITKAEPPNPAAFSLPRKLQTSTYSAPPFARRSAPALQRPSASTKWAPLLIPHSQPTTSLTTLLTMMSPSRSARLLHTRLPKVR